MSISNHWFIQNSQSISQHLEITDLLLKLNKLIASCQETNNKNKAQITEKENGSNMHHSSRKQVGS